VKIFADDKNLLHIFFLILPISFLIGQTAVTINIVSLSIFGVYFFLKNKFIFKNSTILKGLFIFYIYLLFNTIFSIDFENSIIRNLGFIRFIFLFIALNYLFFESKKINQSLIFWLIIFLIVMCDVFIEFIFGQNIFGWGNVNEKHGTRIVSFFKDEPIVGSFLLGFFFIILSNFLEIKKKNTLKFFFIISFFFVMLITGERSNTIKLILGLMFFLLIIEHINLKKKIIIISFISLVVLIVMLSSEYIRNRYVGQLYNQINSYEKIISLKKTNDYFRIYTSGYEVFKKYKYFGAGNKNYRTETCNTGSKNLSKKYFCTTHPHQIYFELLAEHGLIGTVFILIFFSLFLIKIFKLILKNESNLIQAGSFIFIFLSFLPFLPSGSFFSNLNLSLFWINFSIMFASNRKTNIFNNTNSV